MSRRLSGDGNYIAGDEGQRYGPEVLFSRGGVSPPRLEHEETLTAALVATFWSITTATKKLSGERLVMVLCDAQPSCQS